VTLHDQPQDGLGVTRLTRRGDRRRRHPELRHLRREHGVDLVQELTAVQQQPGDTGEPHPQAGQHQDCGQDPGPHTDGQRSTVPARRVVGVGGRPPIR
jgi:hypothetical protein